MLNKKTYRLNSFFSGIGGFDIAFENKGFATQMLCEIKGHLKKRVYSLLQ